MTTQPINNENQPILESDKPRLPYQPPSLTMLENCDIGTGGTYVPENNNGLLES